MIINDYKTKTNLKNELAVGPLEDRSRPPHVAVHVSGSEQRQLERENVGQIASQIPRACRKLKNERNKEYKVLSLVSQATYRYISSPTQLPRIVVTVWIRYKYDRDILDND